MSSENSERPERKVGPPSGCRLLDVITCPHCWTTFPPEETLWISSDHPSLRDDPKIHDGARRFPAERFHLTGDALDARGERCAAFACPNCHLEVPRACFELEPFFISIVGGPACGKSFLLPAMTWTLRTILPRVFATQFLEADPRFNVKLHQYEQSLFLNPMQDEPVALEKTQVRGMENLYDQVLFGKIVVHYPRPFIFRMQAADTHGDRAAKKLSGGRTVCLYDNSGESYLPLSEQVGGNFKATDHLGHSQATFFLFDPTQDMRFREACGGRSHDPQMQARDSKLGREGDVLQHTILLNAAARMKRLRGLAESERHSGPLIVVLTKFDAWAGILGDAQDLIRLPMTAPLDGPDNPSRSRQGLHRANIDTLSARLRGMLAKHAEEVVNAAEGFSSDVTYLACSATGHNVQATSINGQTAFGIRPRDVKPFWCELPFLVAMERNQLPLLPVASSQQHRQAADRPPGEANHHRPRQG